MAGQIKVSTSKLAEQAELIERLKKELGDEFNALNSYAARLSSSWKGGAHDAFVNSVKQNATALLNFSNNSQNFANALKAGAHSYEGGEDRAKQIASTKR